MYHYIEYNSIKIIQQKKISSYFMHLPAAPPSTVLPCPVVHPIFKSTAAALTVIQIMSFNGGNYLNDILSLRCQRQLQRRIQWGSGPPKSFQVPPKISISWETVVKLQPKPLPLPSALIHIQVTFHFLSPT